jgi:D-tyrosyl-tRNA(Tyr) deacylase
VRLLLQRVTRAQVLVDGDVVGEIGSGLVVLVGIGHGDTEETALALAGKAVDLRIFRDDDGKTNRSLIDVGGEVLAISQFTLFADTRKGRRPSFLDAAPPELGNALYERFCVAVHERGVKVARGVFGAEMQVELVNDGPMTIWLDSAAG